MQHAACHRLLTACRPAVPCRGLPCRVLPCPGTVHPHHTHSLAHARQDVRLSLAALLATLGADAPAVDVARTLVDLCSPVLGSAAVAAQSTGRRRLGGRKTSAAKASPVGDAVRQLLVDAGASGRLDLDALSVPHVALDALRAMVEDDMGEGPDVLREQDLISPLTENISSDVDMLDRKSSASAVPGTQRTQRLRVLQQRLQVLQSAAFQNTANQAILVRLGGGFLLRTLQRLARLLQKWLASEPEMAIWETVLSVLRICVSLTHDNGRRLSCCACRETVL